MVSLNKQITINVKSYGINDKNVAYLDKTQRGLYPIYMIGGV